jgi:hypothetical protein
MSRSDLEFSIEKVTQENHAKWNNHFSKEYELWGHISSLYFITTIIRDTEKLRSSFRENYT